MKRISLLIIPLFIVGALAVSCGGDGKKTVKVGDTKVDVSGKLPSDFPGDFPKYKGADVQGSATGSQGGISGTVVTWITGDSLDDVTEFYTKSFQDGPWKSTSNGSIGGSSYWSADSADGKKTAYVMVSEADGKTNIVAVVGDKEDFGGGDATSTSDDSSSDEETPTEEASDDSSAEPTEANEPLPDEVNLSDDFPKDRVPLPSGARVTSDSNFSSGGQATFIIELYVKDKPENVSDFFKTELPKKGWENAFSSVSNGEYFLTYSAGDSDGVTISVAESETPGYAKVSLSLTVKG